MVARFVALLRAVNVGRRTVAMRAARDVLTDLGFEDVSSFANSGNLILSGRGATASLEATIRPALESRFGFELTTFVRTASQLRTFLADSPFGTIADGHTHFGLFTLSRLTTAQQTAVEAMSNEQDEVVVVGRDVHWLIRAKSTETSLGPRRWLAALPDVPTTARNMTLLRRLEQRL